LGVRAFFSQRIEDCFHHPCWIAQNLVVPEPQDPYPMCLQHPSPFLIMPRPGGLCVLPSVKLDAECCFEAVEIEDIPAHGMLPPELGPRELPISQ
jgi:hypothetical protein